MTCYDAEFVRFQTVNILSNDGETVFFLTGITDVNRGSKQARHEPGEIRSDASADPPRRSASRPIGSPDMDRPTSGFDCRTQNRLRWRHNSIATACSRPLAVPVRTRGINTVVQLFRNAALVFMWTVDPSPRALRGWRPAFVPIAVSRTAVSRCARAVYIEVRWPRDMVVRRTSHSAINTKRRLCNSYCVTAAQLGWGCCIPVVFVLRRPGEYEKQGFRRRTWRSIDSKRSQLWVWQTRTRIYVYIFVSLLALIPLYFNSASSASSFLPAPPTHWRFLIINLWVTHMINGNVKGSPLGTICSHRESTLNRTQSQTHIGGRPIFWRIRWKSNHFESTVTHLLRECKSWIVWLPVRVIQKKFNWLIYTLFSDRNSYEKIFDAKDVAGIVYDELRDRIYRVPLNSWPCRIKFSLCILSLRSMSCEREGRETIHNH